MAARKPIVEKRTGERYSSKAAMQRHEKSESRREAKREGDRKGKRK